MAGFQIYGYRKLYDGLLDQGDVLRSQLMNGPIDLLLKGGENLAEERLQSRRAVRALNHPRLYPPGERLAVTRIDRLARSLSDL